MEERIYQKATDVRNDFSAVMDRAIYDRPQFISRTKDQLMLVGTEMLDAMLQPAQVHVLMEPGDGGRSIYSLAEIPDIFEEAATEGEALALLSADLLEYARDYYAEFGLYSRAPNRKQHLPYIARALALGIPEKVRGMLVCPGGKSSSTQPKNISTRSSES